MKRCPFCHTAPEVDLVNVGTIELWQIGCAAHLPAAARQGTIRQAISQWNSIVLAVVL